VRTPIAALLLLAAGGCSSESALEEVTTVSIADPSRCLVRLHGKGGTGGSDQVDGRGFVEVSPTGNADGWDGRQWLYFPDDEYAEARQILLDAVEHCREVIVDGFSNGASFAAKLYCRGEDLGGRLIRVVVDDPVPDHGVVDCNPDPTVDVALYWTGALESTARPGWDCAEADWTCEGGTTIGIGAYAEALGTEARESVHDDHTWYRDVPELSDWG
jgi:hypothetical protein